MEYELLIREAEVEDAAELVSFLNRVSVETDFTSLDRNGILMTDTEASGILRRLQLTVQTRNQGAVHLYQQHGFVIEGRQERGAYIEEGKFIDVYLMGRLID